MLKKNKIEIPYDLKLLFVEFKKEIETPTVQYSLSFSDEALSKAKNKIINYDIEPKFKELLFFYIDRTNLKDSEVYKMAKVNRRVFSKIKNEQNYHPSMQTIICFGLALKLTINEFESLLNSANYSLPNNTYFNVAIRYCFENEIFDIDQVNDILYACNLPLLKD